MKPGNKLALVILGWWYLLVVLTEISDSIEIGIKTIGLICLAIFSYTFGYILSYNYIKIADYKKNIYLINSEKIILSILLFQILLACFSLNFLLGNSTNIRDIIFSEPEQIFHVKYIFQVYSTILYPIGLYAVFQYNYFELSLKKKIIVISFFIFDTLISFGRFSLYILTIYILINIITDKKSRKIKYHIILFYSLIGFIFINLVYNARYTGDITLFSGLDGLKNYVYDSIINYHIVGFGILDKFVNKEFIFEDKGILSFGFAEYALTKFINLFGNTLSSSYAELGEYLQSTYINIGDTKYISFPTILLPFYLDFGFFGTCVLLFIMGCLVGQCKYSNYQISSFGKYYSALMLIGIFQTVLISQFLYIPIILNLIGFRYCNENK